MSRRLTFRADGVEVELDDMAALLIERALENVLPGVVDSIERKLESITRNAVEQWPTGPERGEWRRTTKRRSGWYVHPGVARTKPHSRDTFRTSVNVEQNEDGWRVVGRIENDADYWWYIKTLEFWPSTPFVKLVREPVRDAQDDLVVEIADIMVEGMRRG